MERGSSFPAAAVLNGTRYMLNSALLRAPLVDSAPHGRSVKHIQAQATACAFNFFRCYASVLRNHPYRADGLDDTIDENEDAHLPVSMLDNAQHTGELDLVPQHLLRTRLSCRAMP